MCIHVGLVCTHIPYSVLIPSPSGCARSLSLPVTVAVVPGPGSRCSRCDEVGCCPGHTDSLSALSPRS